ncbi:hypothetical protein Rs2_49988 [Raphanus sativus]|uniref:Uncharacterized protein LOC130505141 n=1 Tax=Raphanus sativus TaxID=3726 RepID=A0A9W3CVX6_RAPSA|nr:uncharacterized protein LOC130505141 [Raphanus sativus]KAJ4868462.1 hypothetical protein Rs2_49988 [Raphanus sativus]
MEPPPERSKRLHNFTLPYLRWGQQRFLRCVNLPSHSHHPSYPSPDHATIRSVSTAGAVATARPWNLRTRGAEPGEESPGMKRGIDEEERDKDEKLKFSVSLLKAEIEEDFSIIIGKRPPRRPKKRPRIVQKKLNTIFPGLWLSEEVTIDSYNVPEAVET